MARKKVSKPATKPATDGMDMVIGGETVRVCVGDEVLYTFEGHELWWEVLGVELKDGKHYVQLDGVCVAADDLVDVIKQ